MTTASSTLETVSEFGQRGAQSSAAVRTACRERRQVQVLGLKIAGLTCQEISRRLSVSRRTIFRDLEDLGEVVPGIEAIIEDAGVDAHDAWIQLSRIFDGDRSEILDETGNVKPMNQWPLIFRQCLNVVIEDISQRSHDGETKDKDGGWDKSGKRVRVLGIDPGYLRAVELVMKHKSVDALVQQKAGDVHVNVTITAQQQRLDRARKRLEKVIDLPAVPQVTDTSGAGWLPPGAKT